MLERLDNFFDFTSTGKEIVDLVSNWDSVSFEFSLGVFFVFTLYFGFAIGFFPLFIDVIVNLASRFIKWFQHRKVKK